MPSRARVVIVAHICLPLQKLQIRSIFGFLPMKHVYDAEILVATLSLITMSRVLCSSRLHRVFPCFPVQTSAAGLRGR